MTARDPRFILAAILLLGYYALLFLIGLRGKPIDNPDIFKDGMIVLGPPVGAVFAALFRSDAVDEKRADNTGEAFKAIAAAQAAPPPVQPVIIKQPEDQPVPVAPTNEGA